MGKLTHIDEEGNARMVDVGGKAVTHAQAVAQAHYNRWRLRCQSCSTVFCGRCLTIGYHEGYDCEGWRRKAEQRNCVFCGQGLAPPVQLKDAPEQAEREGTGGDGTVSDVGNESGAGAELTDVETGHTAEASAVTTNPDSLGGATRAPAVYEEDLYALRLDGCRTYAEIGTLVDLDESDEKVSVLPEDQEAKVQDDNVLADEDDKESDVQMIEGEQQALTEDDEESESDMAIPSAS